MHSIISFLAVAAAATAVAAVPQGYGQQSYGGGNSNSYGGSNNNNNYGGNSGNSYGGNSGNSYGGNSNSYGGNSNNNNYGSSSSSSSSSMMSESTSSMMADMTTSSMMAESTSMMMSESMMMSSSTMMDMSTSTSSAMYSSATYGSGSSNWGGSGYDSCVQQCMASYGAPMATCSPAASPYASMGSSGSGATHTIIVAPTQGVLRYMPFAVNASVGDTIKFMWGANNHTVTKSSQLELCNKTSNAPFASGEQNKSFVFTQVVNDTNPTFFYCGTPNHCEKGMFGIINPPTSANQGSSSAGMMAQMMQNSSDMAAMGAYAASMTKSNAAAASWGASMDMASMPQWAQSMMAENIMYTRMFLAANPETFTNGQVDLSSAASTPLMFPQDITAATANAAAAPSSASSSASGTAASSAPTSTDAKKSGARGLSASGAVVGAAALFAAVLAL